MKMNYCFQKKNKYLWIFTTKDLINLKNYLRKNDYDDVKVISQSGGNEIDFTNVK